MKTQREIIESGNAVLGIEFGSTRIKAVLIGADGAPLASGGHEWENRLENGFWTYPLDAVWAGLQAVSYTHLDVYKRQILHCARGKSTR